MTVCQFARDNINGGVKEGSGIVGRSLLALHHIGIVTVARLLVEFD